MTWLLVGIGGIVGAVLRYQISRWMLNRWTFIFPVPTLLINLTGSFLLGWFTSDLTTYFPHFGSNANLLLGTGFCGAYTTFSTFSFEAMTLLRTGRKLTALLYVIISCAGGFVLSAIGLYTMTA